MTIRQWSVRRNEKIACHVTVRGEKAEDRGSVRWGRWGDGRVGDGGDGGDGVGSDGDLSQGR